MKQYCRYCNYLITGNGTYCEAFDREMKDSTAKAVNHCKEFLFNPMDAFAENPNDYKPREKHEDYEYCGTLFETEVKA